MTNRYFKSIEPQGNVYMQLRYYSPNGTTDNCYEAIIILISPTGVVKQIVDSYNKTDFDFFQRNYQPSSAEEFIDVQEKHVLGGSMGTRKKLYDTYYEQWKDFYKAKKVSLENVRGSSTTNNWNYYDRLADQWVINGVNEKREGLTKIEKAVQQQANISNSDIYREARQNATLDYVAERI